MSVYKLKGTSGTVINQSFPFEGSIVLGSAENCDVQLAEKGVSPNHAEITLLDGKALLLTDLNSDTGTLLNGEPVIETHLASGDEIRIGTCRFMLQAPGLRPERLLTEEMVGKRTRRWPKVLGWGSVLTTAAALAVLKFKPEWLDAIQTLFG
jgi:pSer/pThr/pTyr-binding forkhead associated (FHA) protein